MRRASLILALATLALGVPAHPGAEVVVWTDDAGQTHITNDPESVPPGARREPAERSLRDLWQGQLRGEPAPTARRAGPEEARLLRVLRGAEGDIARGETARASEALEDVLQDHPDRPEAHWHLAHLDRQRGRFASAETHLRAFLVAAGDRFDPWRARAEASLRELEAERRIADEQASRGPLRLVAVSHPHFRIRVDAELESASADYARTVVGYLDGARRSVARELGTAPDEPTGVVLYGKASYLSAYGHRFTFQTVGFFDGRIHVASAAHPRNELRALLYHEFTHAAFREATGGDRPFWLNEGMAELLERIGRGQGGLGRQDRAALRLRIQNGDWIPLRSLAQGFAGLDDGEAKTAYLEAAAAAAWIVATTDRSARAKLLGRLGEGASVDDALRATVGRDTEGVDAAVRAWVLAEFVPASR